MERNTAARAADMLTDLIVAHVSESPENIDVHDAMAIRDDLREFADSPEQYTVPSVGDIVHDPESNPRFGDGKVRITGIPGTIAMNHGLDSEDPRAPDTVADYNPQHPDDAPVVEGVYVNGSAKIYAFPVTRLEEME